MVVDQKPILYGSYFLPPSANELYDPTRGKYGRGLTLRKSEVAREYTDNLQNHLNYPDHRFELYLDEVGLRIIREWSITLKAKRMKLHQKPVYLLETLYVFASDQRDVDGGHKCLQDAIMEWIGVNDNRVWRVTQDKTVDSSFPHVEFVLRPLFERVSSGYLLAKAKQECSALVDSFYTDDTVHAGSI